MQIFGLQKMTLLDYPGRVACTVFLGGCDFRCPFCHNFGLVDGTDRPQMTDGALLDFLKTRKGLLDGVAITGGEPCLQPGLYDLVSAIHDLGFSVKLDTNGCHPDMLRRLMDASLVDYVAMDIKNSPEKYAMTAGLPSLNLEPVQESMDLLMHAHAAFEFRTTVVEELHTLTDFEAIGPWIHGAPAYYLQPFVDRESVPFGGLHAPSSEALKEYADAVRPHVGKVEIRGK